MRLIVAEKPSVGRDIAGALGRHRREKGALVGEGWTVTWALGHLAELAPPDAYGEEYKKWRLESLPILPDRFKVRMSPKTRDQFAIVRSLMRDPSVTEVVNACDAGREGEFIFAYLYGLSGCKKPVCGSGSPPSPPRRSWRASAPCATGAAMKPLEDAARSRGEADWIVGMNATRAYSVRFGRRGNVLSVGRVQTPTLKLLVAREKEIQDFKPEKFWTVHARFAREGRTYDGVWFKKKQNRLKEEAAAAIAGKVRGGPGTVRKAEKKTATERPPLLYDLTELQRNANARYGFTAERTLRAAQALYEERKLITYPRTSSRYLSRDMVGTPQKAGRGRRGAARSGAVRREALGRAEAPDQQARRRRFEGHGPPRHHPDRSRSLGRAAARSGKGLRSGCAALSRGVLPGGPLREHDRRHGGEGGDVPFSGRVVLEAGWRALYPDGVGGKKEKEPPVLPPIAVGQEWEVAKVGVKEGETKPPPRYSESALLGTMETAGKLVEDEEFRQAMKESGLGTPATRAAIIERLIKVGYVEREKKTLVPTEKGRALISLLGESPLSSPELTARGRSAWPRWSGAPSAAPTLWPTSAASPRRSSRRARNGGGEAGGPSRSREPLGACPKCGAPVVETKKAYGCSAWKTTGCDFAIWKRSRANA